MSSHIVPLTCQNDYFKFLPCSSLVRLIFPPEMEQHCSFFVCFSQDCENSFRAATCVPTLLPWAPQVEPKPISVWLNSLIRHSSGNPGLRAQCCSCTTKHNYLILIRKSDLLPRRYLGVLEDTALRVSFGKICPKSSAFYHRSFLEYSGNSQYCLILLLLLQTASQRWSSWGMQMRLPTPTAQHQPWAVLFVSHCARYGEGGGGLISLSPKMGLLLKNSNTQVTPFYIYSIILMLFHLLNTDLIQWCK